MSSPRKKVRRREGFSDPSYRRFSTEEVRLEDVATALGSLIPASGRDMVGWGQIMCRGSRDYSARYNVKSTYFLPFSSRSIIKPRSASSICSKASSKVYAGEIRPK